ncbi:DUF3365 domain-containing protein [Algoriphagus sp. AK58]|uniref:Tll0287-like domain-containing protein n=1 Tax=Algoriphagus sp. AK58 TaxID=1406877 RepID=UPI001650BB0B|nr:DUF3365 domain-containing protein [Algoriphagus sp. AK58]MBC6367686.1 hypothetical protein [Algoriphagus sp. AK58]
MKKLFFLIIVVWAMFSCGPQERVSKETFEEVNRNMEVKRLTEVEIIQEAMVWGDSISLEAQSLLISNLQKAISETGVQGAIEFCNLNALPIIRDLEKEYSIQIRRVSNRYRNPIDAPNQEELPLLEAYEYNAESGIKSDPNIQKLQNGEVLLYTKPIIIPNGMCLSCHGEPGKEINQETLQKLAELYPDDKAKGHQVGDLRGMWAIRIPKKEVVKRL